MGRSDEPRARICLLGRFEVRIGQQLVIDRSWRRRKAQAILKLLALHRDRGLHREQLFELLWPDLDPAAAANNLRQNLHYLRSALQQAGEVTPIVVVSGDMVALSPEVGVDTEAFRSDAHAARSSNNDVASYERALALYVGDLLPEDIYEDWTEPFREELKALHNELLIELSHLYAGQKEGGRAAELLHQLLRTDPVHEEAHRSLMRLLASSGNREKALRQYRKCRALLQRELGVEPSPETEALNREILEGRLSVQATAPTAAPAVAGRDQSTGGLVQGVAGTRITRLWTRPAFWSAALVLLVVAAGGGVAGGLLLIGDDSPPEIKFRHESKVRLQRVSGDCLTQDMLLKGNTEGPVTGDIVGRLATALEGTLYAGGEGCDWGLLTTALTITDKNDNTLYGMVELPLSIVRGPRGESLAGTATATLTITGGTGIYEGTAGQGACTIVAANQLSPDEVVSEYEAQCGFQVTKAGVSPRPVVIQVGASPTEIEPPDATRIVVLYGNPRNQSQSGLSLRLPVPEGTEILAAARGEPPPATGGERTWRLPDLPAGATQRFEFTVQFLRVETSPVPIVVELEGEGFARPLSSNPIAITVAQ